MKEPVGFGALVEGLGPEESNWLRDDRVVWVNLGYWWHPRGEMWREHRWEDIREPDLIYRGVP